MKRLFPFVLLPLLIGCGTPADSGKISVTCTSFAPFDWASSLLKGTEKIDLVLLNNKGLDPHSYEPTVRDVARIGKSDLFIYVGGESEAWVEDALKQSSKPGRKTIDLLEALGDKAKEEESKEGMEGEEEEEEEGALDEHVWLSVKNASLYVSVFEEELCKIDPEEASLIHENALSYQNALQTLDESFAEAVRSGNKDTLVFADRFPFRYFVEDYQLDYFAAFAGCSAESEASFQTVVFLAKKVDELGLSTILQIETSDGKLAQTVKEATKEKNQTIRVLNSMQGVKPSDNKSYVELMEGNLAVLKEALK